jgi:pectin methylesterase-like acyl-CoA thioesterase
MVGRVTVTKTLIVFWIFIASVSGVSAQSVGDFRTHQSGNWSDVNSWEKWNGSTWVNPASNFPTASDGIITVQNGDSLLLDTTISIDQAQILSGGILVVGVGETLTVADGADSVDLVVGGELNNFGSLVATGRISVENGGLYVHSTPSGAGSLPLITWRTGSTCRIDSSSGSNPSNINAESFYNFIWNASNQGANGGPNFNDGAVIAGDLTVSNSKGLQFRLTNLTGGQTKNIYIHGNVNVNGSNALLTSTGSGADTLAKAVINVDGNVIVTAGQLSLNNSGSAYAEWKIKGNLSVTGGTLQSGASGWYGRRTLNFSGGGAQTFTVTPPGTIGTAPTLFTVTNGTALQLNSPLTLMANGALSLESLGTIVTTSTDLLTIPASATLLGGSDSSYVNGPLAIVVTATSATETFPIGKGSIYRPVTLTLNHDASTATTYSVEMFNASPPALTLPATLSSVSSVRYYRIIKGSGANLSPTLGGTIQLTYGPDDLVTDSSVVRIAEDSSAASWINLGGSGTRSGTGTITSNAFYSLTTNDFALATVNANVSASLATLTTTAVTKISTTIATTGGNITNDGGAAVSDRGVCWNTVGMPTISDMKLGAGAGSGVFKNSLTGLTPGTTYHLRSYATNSAGTAYGNEEIFSTLTSIVPPTVITTAISNIQVTTAISGGTVTDWGGDSVTARGVCWSTTGSPTTAQSHSLDGSDIGSYASGLAPLAGNTTYYVRAYAVNSAGVGYGNELSFTTQTPQPDTTVVVAKDGSGDYTTVQAAFRAVPSNYTGHWKIFVKNGTYYEKDTLASGKINVILEGESRDSTIVTYDDYADKYGGNNSGNPGTSGSFTIAIDGSDFMARNITFQNTYSPQPGINGTQAVALRVQGDRHQYINCRILGYQDTYYTWGGSGTGRLYLKDCFIEGSVDFIFGRDIAVFDSCTIHVIKNGGTITAASTDGTSQYGYVFRNCTILADSVGYDGVVNSGFYFGRPWQASPRTVFLHCYVPANLNPAGWLAWNVAPALYGEYNSYGPGSATSGRVAWSSQLSSDDASGYTLTNIFSKNSAASSLILYDWMPSEGESSDVVPLPVEPVIVAAPKEFTLSKNFPNPFNPTTTIEFTVRESGHATLKVYNVVGQEVAELFNGEAEPGVSYREKFDASRCASGVYFCVLRMGSQRLVQKMSLLK